MVRFLFRVLGTLILAAAAIMAVVDATRSVAASKLVVTPLIDSWSATFPGGLQSLQSALSGILGGILWEPVTVSILQQPGFAVLAVLALLLYIMGRKPVRRTDDWA